MKILLIIKDAIVAPKRMPNIQSECNHKEIMLKKEFIRVVIAIKKGREIVKYKEKNYNYCVNCNEKFEDNNWLIKKEESIEVIPLYKPHDYINDYTNNKYLGDDVENNLIGLNNL